jgi:hypothetical protein
MPGLVFIRTDLGIIFDAESILSWVAQPFRAAVKVLSSFPALPAEVRCLISTHSAYPPDPVKAHASNSVPGFPRKVHNAAPKASLSDPPCAE